MIKRIKIALISISLILVSILGLTIMLNGMFNGIKVKGVSADVTTNRVSNTGLFLNGIPTSTNHSSSGEYLEYEKAINRSFIRFVRVDTSDGNRMGNKMLELGDNSNHTFTLTEVQRWINNQKPSNGVGQDNKVRFDDPQWQSLNIANGLTVQDINPDDLTKDHYYMYITKNVKCDFFGGQVLTIPQNMVVHILLNGYAITGDFKVNVQGSLRLYDQIPMTQVWGTENKLGHSSLRPQATGWGSAFVYNGGASGANQNNITKYYGYDSNTNAYTNFLYNSNGNPPAGSTDVTADPTFQPNTHIAVKGSVLGASSLGYASQSGGFATTASQNTSTQLTALNGTIHMYGINLVGNQNPNTHSNFGTNYEPALIHLGSPTSKSYLYNCSIIGNNLQNNNATALKLDTTFSSTQVEMKWSRIYGNKVATGNKYGETRSNAKMSDIVANGNLAGLLYRNTVGVTTTTQNNTIINTLDLMNATIATGSGLNLGNRLLSVALGDAEIIRRVSQSSSGAFILMLHKGSFTYRKDNRNIMFFVSPATTLRIENNGDGVGTIGYNTGAIGSGNLPTIQIHGKFASGTNNINFNSILEVDQGYTVNLISGATGASLYGNGSATISSGATAVVPANKTFSGTINNNGGLTIAANGAISGAIINTGTLTIAGTASNISGSGTVTIESTGRATVGSGRTISGAVTNNGTVTIYGTVSNISGSGSVLIQSTGQATVQSGKTVNGTVTNAGTLNVNGTLSQNLTNTGTFNLQSGASYTVVSGKTIDGTINNSGTLTVNGTTSTNTSGIVNNNGSLIVNGVVKSVTGNGTITINANGEVSVRDNNALGRGKVTNSGTLVLYRGASVNDLQNNSSGKVNIEQNNVTITAINNAGTLNIASGATFNTTSTAIGGSVINNGHLNAYGDIHNLTNNASGTVNVRVVNPSFSEFTNHGTLVIYSDASYTVPANKTIGGTVINSGILNFSQGSGLTGTFTNNATLNIGKDTSYTVTQDLGGAITNNGTLILRAKLTGNTIINTGTLNMESNGGISNSNATLTNTGTINLYQGAYGFPADFINENGTLSINNSVSLTVPNDRVWKGTIENKGTFSINATARMEGAIVNTGTLNIRGTFIGDITATQGTIGVTGSVGEENNSSSIDLSSNVTLVIGENAFVYNLKGLGNITIENNATVYVRNRNSVGNNIVNKGTMYLYAEVNVQGTLTNQGNGRLNIYQGVNINNLVNSTTTTGQGVWILGNNITINSINNTGRFTVHGDASFTLKNGTTLNGTVINNGTLNLSAGAILSSNFTNNGTFNIAQDANYTITNNLGGTITNNGVLTANANLSGVVVNSGILNLSAGAILTSNLTNNAGATFNIAQDASYTVTQNLNGTITNNGILTVNANSTVEGINNIGTLIINGIVNSLYGDVNGQVTIEQGGRATVIANQTQRGVVTNNGTLTIAGTVNNVSGSGTVTIQQSGNATVVANKTQSGVVTNNGDLTVIGTVGDVSGSGTVTIQQGGQVTIVANKTVSGTLTNNGILNVAGVVDYLINNSNGTVNIKDTARTPDITNEGQLTLEANTRYTVQANKTFGGSIITDGTMIIAGTVNDISGSGTVTIQQGGVATVAANKTQSGVLVNNGALTVYGSVSNVSGTGTVTIQSSGSAVVGSGREISDTIVNDGVLTVYGSVSDVAGNGVVFIQQDGIATVVETKTLSRAIANAGRLIVNGTVSDASGSGIVTIQSSGSVVVGSDKEISGSVVNNGNLTVYGIVNNLSGTKTGRVFIQEDGKAIVTIGNILNAAVQNNGTLTVIGTVSDVSGNGTVTIEENAEASVLAGNLLNGIVTNAGTLNIAGTLSADLTNTGTLNIQSEGNYTVMSGNTIAGKVNNEGTLTVNRRATVFEVNSNGNLIVNNGGKVRNLISEGQTTIEDNGTVNNIVVNAGYTKFNDNAIIDDAELNDGTLEISATAKVAALNHTEGKGTLIDHRIERSNITADANTNETMKTWVLSGSIGGGLLFLIIVIVVVLLLLKRRKGKRYM